MNRNKEWGAKGKNPHGGLFNAEPKQLKDIRYSTDVLSKDDRNKINDIKDAKAYPVDFDPLFD